MQTTSKKTITDFRVSWTADHERVVQKDRRVYAFSCCTACGTGWGAEPGAAVKRGAKCETTTCLACGSRQCMGNGLGRGQCAVCYIGLLPGWSGSNRQCGYKGCCNKAVAAVGGQVRYACTMHLERNGKADYVLARLEEREKHWQLWPIAGEWHYYVNVDVKVEEQ